MQDSRPFLPLQGKQGKMQTAFTTSRAAPPKILTLTQIWLYLENQCRRHDIIIETITEDMLNPEGMTL